VDNSRGFKNREKVIIIPEIRRNHWIAILDVRKKKQTVNNTFNGVKTIENIGYNLSYNVVYDLRMMETLQFIDGVFIPFNFGFFLFKFKVVNPHKKYILRYFMNMFFICRLYAWYILSLTKNITKKV